MPPPLGWERPLQEGLHQLCAYFKSAGSVKCAVFRHSQRQSSCRRRRRRALRVILLVCCSLYPRMQGRKFVPLPTVEAAGGDLAWRQAFSAKLGRHVVASKDLPAGTLVLMERPVVAVPRSK